MPIIVLNTQNVSLVTILHFIALYLLTNLAQYCYVATDYTVYTNFALTFIFVGLPINVPQIHVPEFRQCLVSEFKVGYRRSATSWRAQLVDATSVRRALRVEACNPGGRADCDWQRRDAEKHLPQVLLVAVRVTMISVYAIVMYVI